MIIADSGSTKTAWCVTGDEIAEEYINTEGINPFFQSESDIIHVLKEQLLPHISIGHHPRSIYFYGAGCSTPEKIEILKRSFSSIFNLPIHIKVNHDLLGAARSTCGNDPGLVGILGTGSNSCVYDGVNIVENVASLGYILGDEGSGAHIGKTFLKVVFENKLPKKLIENFILDFKLTREEVLGQIYGQKFPNRFLASITKFIYPYKDDPAVAAILEYCFEAFVDHNLCKYQNFKQLNFYCTGSIGFYFSDALKSVLGKRGINLVKIQQSPILGLVNYHKLHTFDKL